MRRRQLAMYGVTKGCCEGIPLGPKVATVLHTHLNFMALFGIHSCTLRADHQQWGCDECRPKPIELSFSHFFTNHTNTHHLMQTTPQE
mmetsp:Transcript_38061/g.44368  ORF Transcript_38061/g.44368 Transcript_38061/m.44368 type:complete len:88 (+) Transcript_38061:774-1037(+)